MLTRIYHRLFPLPSPIEMAARELAEAKLAALQEQTMAEYAAARSKQHDVMVEYHAGRINRLNAYIVEQTGGGAQEVRGPDTPINLSLYGHP